MRAGTKIMGIAGVLLAGITASAWAQGRGPMGGEADGPFASLKLSPEQKQKVRGFRETAMKQAEPLRLEMQAKAAEMKQLWLADKPDRRAIERKQTEMDTIRQKLRGIWTDFHLQLHAVLTSEQRAKMAEHMGGGPGMRGGHGMGRGGMHPGGMGGCPCGDLDSSYGGQ